MYNFTKHLYICLSGGMVYTGDSKSSSFAGLGVQIPSQVPPFLFFKKSNLK